MSDTTQATTTTTQATPPQQMSGHPAEGTTIGGSASPATTTTASPASIVSAPPAQKEIYLAGKKFTNMDELAAYTSQLQAQASTMDQLREVINPKTGKPQDPSVELGELIFQDPARAVQEIERRTEDRILGKISQQQAQENLRNRFYTDNPDMKGKEDLVDFYTQQMLAKKEFANMNDGEALSKLATAVRARVASFRGEQTNSQELPNTTQTVVGTGSGAPRADAAPQAGATMFDQMKEFQKSKRLNKK